ncbi:MAG: NAD-dependent epimerase/dehydratase family protein [Deltaproteobacteria bacterium]|nr:NAD-dependent epimerase/dehydratase family protein [Deltaproteobacteria bacterium]MBW2419981.1 NAD-dependent epimerase/dehydratase family protein [Deltaproteobacteria bacterium]
MKVVVTGGSGFIGSHVVDALVDAGADVTVVDHRVPPRRDDVGYEDADILDLSSMLVATQGAEHIFHLGAEANVDYAFKYPVYSTALNVMGTTNVLEAARINGAKRVHLASTVWVYNDSTGEGAADESVTFAMNGGGHIYTTTKMTCEMLCHNYRELYGLPTTVLRYGIPYGPRMREELLIPIFLKKALAGEPLTVAGEGQQYRNFVYVRDLADAHVLAMSELAENETYNLEGARKVTVLEVAENIRALVGDHVRIEFTPERAGDFAGKEISADKAIRELGWKRSVDFEEGLERTVEWFCGKWGHSQSVAPGLGTLHQPPQPLRDDRQGGRAR